jgi:hypothetical protein
MAKSGHSKHRHKYKIVSEGLAAFDKLTRGHKKLLVAIGKL